MIAAGDDIEVESPQSPALILWHGKSGERESKRSSVKGSRENGPDSPVTSAWTAAREETVREYIETGTEEGANRLLDGRELSGPENGHSLGPTFFDDVTSSMTIAVDEILGPVLALVRAESYEDALQTVNESAYGNAASLFTADGGEAKTFRHEVEAGDLGVNIGTAAPMAFFHFGGRQDSFFGDLHAQGDDMVRFYTDETVYIERWPSTRSE